MENHVIAGSPRKAQPHSRPSRGNFGSDIAGPGAGANPGVPSPFGTRDIASALPPYRAPGLNTATEPTSTPPPSQMADSCSQRVVPPFMPGSEATHDKLQQELHRHQQQYQQQFHRQPQSPVQHQSHQQQSQHFSEQQHSHQLYQDQQHQYQQSQHRQASPVETAFESRSESMRTSQGTPSSQQPRPPATSEEKLRIREKYKQRVQERNVQIYQNALEEVLRKERQEATQRALFKINCPTRVRLGSSR